MHSKLSSSDICSILIGKDAKNERRQAQAAGGARPRAREGPPGARNVRRRGNRMQIRDEDSGTCVLINHETQAFQVCCTFIVYTVKCRTSVRINALICMTI